jgi:hypothetical protein
MALQHITYLSFQIYINKYIIEDYVRSTQISVTTLSSPEKTDIIQLKEKRNRLLPTESIEARYRKVKSGVLLLAQLKKKLTH